MMFGKILVPLGGSTVGNSVLPVARALALASGAQMVLLRVLPEHVESGQGSVQAEAYADLERLRDKLRASPLSVYSRVRFGDPAEQILAAVGHEGADLIVMATHGLAGIDRLIAGSARPSDVAID